MTIENDLPNGPGTHLARTCAIADVRIFQVSALDKALRGVDADKGLPRPVPSSTLRRVNEQRKCFHHMTYVHYGRRIISRLGQGSVILLWAVSASAQTPGTSTSQVCTQDPAYCSDTGASSTTTGSGTSSSASSGGSGGGVRAEEAARRRRSPTPHAATVSPWMRGVAATEWQSDTCAVRDPRPYRSS